MPVLENARYEKYVQNLIAGMSQRKAYREAFPNSAKWKDETVDVKASVLFDKVLERYCEIQNEQMQKALLTRYEKRKLLAEIARNKASDDSDRIKAIDTDNKMENEYVSRVEMSSLDTEKSKLDDLIQQIRGGDATS